MKHIIKLLIVIAATIAPLFSAFAKEDAVKTTKILAIGNSFSMDSVDQNLWQIAKADGTTLIIGDMYIGGCSIDRHMENVDNDAPAYQYTKINAEGKHTTINEYKLSQAVIEEDWDYISIQQASHFSGLAETYSNLSRLVSWLKEKAPKAEIVFHQTWAYSPTSTHGAFKDYGSDQWKMYGMICNTVIDQTKQAGIKTIIPTGTAIQNARRYFDNYDLTRDGFHLSLGLGRYIAACTWYETLCNKSVIGNTYIPDGSENGTEAVSAADAAICQKAAHNATLQFMTEEAAHERFAPTEENLAARKEFSKYRFGIFIHWGVYAMMCDGEWIMNNKKIKADDYSHLAPGFYPSRFDAAQWARIFKASGARYVTLTSRHHDGFSMFNSSASDYNIVKGSPFGRDVVGELSKALADNGLKFHLYYSHLDWKRNDYWPLGRVGHDTGRPEGKPGDWEHYLEFINAQLTELLTNYGPIESIWFDGVWDMNQVAPREGQPRVWHLYEQYELIHKLQPGCLVANNHHLNTFAGEDFQIFEKDVPGHNVTGFSKGTDVSQTLPLETCETIGEAWGYAIHDRVKTTKELIQLLATTSGKGANLLLNVGPLPDGTLPEAYVNRLLEIGKWMDKYGESIYETEAGITGEQAWGSSTQKGSTLYLHILNNDTPEIEIPVGKNANKVLSVNTFDGENVAFTQTRTGIRITTPAVGEEFDKIVVVKFKKNL